MPLSSEQKKLLDQMRRGEFKREDLPEIPTDPKPPDMLDGQGPPEAPAPQEGGPPEPGGDRTESILDAIKALLEEIQGDISRMADIIQGE